MKREEALRIIKECKEKGFKHTFYTLNEYHTALDIAIKALEQQPCEDAISRQAVLNALYALCDTGETLKENPWRDNPHIDAVIETIEELPPVTPQQKTGHWIKDDITERSKSAYKHKCDRCGAYHRAMYDYCPSCGIKMIEPQESEDKE